jgi:hypothetical protein
MKGSSTENHYPVRPDEREGLQALLRGAREALAVMPPTAPRRRSVEVLEAGLLDLLMDDQREPRESPEAAPRSPR